MNPQDLSDQLLTTMINADRSAAAALVEQALADGIEPRQVIADILDPAIVRLDDCGRMKRCRWRRTLSPQKSPKTRCYAVFRTRLIISTAKALS